MHLLVDSSASMGFRDLGPMSKLEYASFFAACFAWLVVRGHDMVSLQLFDEKIRSFIPPGSSMKHLDQILNRLEHNTPGGLTSRQLPRWSVPVGFSAGRGRWSSSLIFWTTPPPFSTH